MTEFIFTFDVHNVSSEGKPAVQLLHEFTFHLGKSGIFRTLDLMMATLM